MATTIPWSTTVSAENHQTDGPAVMGKLIVVWVSTITGLSISEWAAIFAIVYTILQCYVLIRDKIWRNTHFPSKDSNASDRRDS